MKLRKHGLLLLISFTAVLIHGYHPYVEDAEIYVPGIVKILHPSYYPFGQEFFETHAHLTLFPNLIAGTVKATHIPLDWTLFLWHFVSIFLFLLACWRIAAKCFATSAGRWAAIAMVAALLTLPVAGTALYIFDQYLNPRSLSIFSDVFAIDAMIEKKYFRMALWLGFTAVIHPLMTVFGLAFVILIAVSRKSQSAPAPAAFAALGALFGFKSPSPIYWQCLNEHSYYFLLRWQWYEWLGIIAPLALLWWFRSIARQTRQHNFELLARTTVAFGFIFFAAGLIVTIPHEFALLAVYQPMRSLLLVYVFFVLISGGLLGEYLLKKRPLRWLLLFVPVCCGMFIAQLQLFPANRHVEWPGIQPKNPWLQAFLWIRENTPSDAIFALDPRFMDLPGEDHQGFRAAAERSRLADSSKDWSAVVLYPWLPLADHVFEQTQAARGWKSFRAENFARLNHTYGVSWVVVQQPGPDDLTCPYQNGSLRVCRVESSPKQSYVRRRALFYTSRLVTQPLAISSNNRCPAGVKV